MIKILVDNEEINTTPSHPFYVQEKGWIEAQHLSIGDTLINSTGKLIEINHIEHIKLEEKVSVYNFEVEDFHTYFVGLNGILVHNDCIVHQGKQDKHIPDSNNYKQQVSNGKNPSILTVDAQQLLDDFAGKGTVLPGTNKERVDFGQIIGKFYDTDTGKYMDTTKGIIHYDSNNGAHIVPSRP